MNFEPLAAELSEKLAKLASAEADRYREALEWILARHADKPPPWRCDCDVCATCREALGLP